MTQAKPKQRIKAWSWSRLKTHDQCPLKLHLSVNVGLKEPSNEAMDRGNRLHKLAESYVQAPPGTRVRIPAELSMIKKELRELRRNQAEPEAMWGFTGSWEPCAWNDWDRCRIRMKVDAVDIPEDGVVRITDYKTGKVREEEHLDQLDLYATGAMAIYEAKEIRTRMLYVDHGVELPKTYTTGGSVFTNLTKHWEERTAKMLSDTRFTPNPGYYCSYCHYRKSNGGPCKF